MKAKAIQIYEKLKQYRTLYCNEYRLSVAYGNMAILFVEDKAILSSTSAIKTASMIDNVEKWLPIEVLLESMPIELEELEDRLPEDYDNPGYPDFQEYERYYDTVQY